MRQLLIIDKHMEVGYKINTFQFYFKMSKFSQNIAIIIWSLRIIKKSLIPSVLCNVLL